MMTPHEILSCCRGSNPRKVRCDEMQSISLLMKRYVAVHLPLLVSAIVEAGEWDDPRVGNRDFAWARIDIPGPVDLWAVSVHFPMVPAALCAAGRPAGRWAPSASLCGIPLL